MLLLLSALFVFATIAGFVLFVRSLTTRTNQLKELQDSPPLSSRPLFEPTDDELRAYERGLAIRQAEEQTAARVTEKRRVSDEFEARVGDFLANPDRKTAIGLICDAAATGDAEVFGNASLRLIRFFKEERPEFLSAADLAELLESQISIMSQQESMPGIAFRLREEIAEFRPSSEDVS